MSLINPLYLAALSALSVPLIIHLIGRRSPNKIILPTMVLLVMKNRQKHFIAMSTLSELLIMLTRMLVVFFLVMYFAGMLFPDMGVAEKHNSGNSTSKIFVVDNSLSMRYQNFGSSSIDRALSKINSILVDKPAARCSLYTTGTKLKELIALNGKFPSIEKALHSEQPSLRSGSLSSSMDSLAPRIKRMGNEHPDIYFFTDFQKNIFQGKARISDFSHPEFGSLKVIDTGIAKPGNAYIKSWKLEKIGGKLHLSFRLCNGGVVKEECQIALFDNSNIKITEWDAVLKPDGLLTFQYDFKQKHIGNWHGKLLIKGDEFKEDNTVYIAYNQPPPETSLIIARRNSKKRSSCLTKALRSLKKDDESVLVENINENKLNNTTLIDQKNIFLLNPLLLKNKFVKRFIKNGGYAIVFNDYEKSRWRLGDVIQSNGLVSKKTTMMFTREKGSKLFPEDYWFDADAGDRLPVSKAIDIEIIDKSKIRVFARFDNKIPAIFETAVGAGKVLFFNFPGNSAETALVHNMYFVMFLSRTINFSAQKKDDCSISLEDATVFSSTPFAEFTVRTPEGDNISLRADHRGQVRLSGFSTPGIYTVRNLKSGLSRYFAVNIDPSESDFHKAGLDSNFINITSDGKQNKTSDASHGSSRITLPLLLLILAFLIIEQFLDGKKGFSRRSLKWNDRTR